MGCDALSRLEPAGMTLALQMGFRNLAVLRRQLEVAKNPTFRAQGTSYLKRSTNLAICIH
jgi:hypothetical protein